MIWCAFVNIGEASLLIVLAAILFITGNNDSVFINPFTHVHYPISLSMKDIINTLYNLISRIFLFLLKDFCSPFRYYKIQQGKVKSEKLM